MRNKGSLKMICCFNDYKEWDRVLDESCTNFKKSFSVYPNIVLSSSATWDAVNRSAIKNGLKNLAYEDEDGEFHFLAKGLNGAKSNGEIALEGTTGSQIGGEQLDNNGEDGFDLLDEEKLLHELETNKTVEVSEEIYSRLGSGLLSDEEIEAFIRECTIIFNKKHGISNGDCEASMLIGEFIADFYTLLFCVDEKMGKDYFVLLFDEDPTFDGERFDVRETA